MWPDDESEMPGWDQFYGIWLPDSYRPEVSRETDEEGFYDSTGEWWQDQHHYSADETDEVMKLIDEALS